MVALHHGNFASFFSLRGELETHHLSLFKFIMLDPTIPIMQCTAYFLATSPSGEDKDFSKKYKTTTMCHGLPAKNVKNTF